MMIKLYDFKSSPNCQRVKVVLAEKTLRTTRSHRFKEQRQTPESQTRQSAGLDRRFHRALQS